MLATIRTACRPYALLPLRLAIGLALLVQGWVHLTGTQGLIRSLERGGIPMADALAWPVMGIELLGGLLVLLGFQTRGAAAVLLLWLGVDCFVLHLGNGWFADQGGFQVPLLLFLGTLSLLLGGAGRASVDSIRGLS
jgi:putative oxidoreductase